MKDEIKEILDKLKIKNDRYSYYLKYNMSYENKDEDYEAHLLLDCITNLQERCKYLERSNNRREDEIMSLRDECVDGETYKSRNEKAIEYIKQHQVRISIAGEKELGFCDEFDIFSNPIILLNILQGEDKQ